MRIAVIGAGITGLTAAYELAKNGHTVSIFEESQEIGGLAAGFPIHGTSLEKGYHHLFRTDTDIIELVRELGIEDTLMWYKSSMGVVHQGHLCPFSTPADLLRFSPLPLRDRVRLGFVVLYLQKTKDWQRFVSVSAAQWMRKWCGKRAYEVIWEPLLRGKFHSRYREVSMAWLWARIHIRANSRAQGEWQEHLGYFRGGFQVLVEALRRELLSRGIIIRCGTSVERIVYDPATDNLHIVVEGTEEEFDRVLCTIPSPAFAALIEGNEKVPPTYLQKLRSIECLGAVCVIFSSPQSLCTSYWNNITDQSSPFLAFLQHTNLVEPSFYQGKHIYYLGTYVPHDHRFFSIDEAALADEFLSYLQKLFPHFNRTHVTETRVFRLRNAQHVATCDYPSKIPEYETAIPGVFLANFSQVFPEDRGTSAAVREGKKVAGKLEIGFIGK